MIDPMTKREIVCWVFLLAAGFLMSLINDRGKGRTGFYWLGILAILLSYTAGALIAMN